MATKNTIVLFCRGLNRSYTASCCLMASVCCSARSGVSSEDILPCFYFAKIANLTPACLHHLACRHKVQKKSRMDRTGEVHYADGSETVQAWVAGQARFINLSDLG